MKLTLSAAMRARDVSRPRPEDLAEAETTDARIGAAKIADTRSTDGKNSADARAADARG